jgi:hypothetical protein
VKQVGHKRNELNSSRTLASLYLDPLLFILEGHRNGSAASEELLRHASLPLQLLIDIKDDGLEYATLNYSS